MKKKVERDLTKDFVKLDLTQDLKELGVLLGSHRTALGIRQDDLARFLGISRITLSRIENNSDKPEWNDLQHKACKCVPTRSEYTYYIGPVEGYQRAERCLYEEYPFYILYAFRLKPEESRYQRPEHEYAPRGNKTEHNRHCHNSP